MAKQQIVWADRLRTPTGLVVTLDQYLALARDWPHACEHGHLQCAAWPTGPCADELMCEREEGEDK